MKALKIVKVAVSLGGVESKIILLIN